MLVVQNGTQTEAFGVPFTVGRSAPIGLTLEDEYVSPRHASFWPTDDGWFVGDLGSANGTWLNGERIYDPRRVAKGDQIRVGHTTLTVVPTVP